MASKPDAWALIGQRMRASRNAAVRPFDGDMPAISDLIRRIDTALIERRAA